MPTVIFTAFLVDFLYIKNQSKDTTLSLPHTANFWLFGAQHSAVIRDG